MDLNFSSVKSLGSQLFANNAAKSPSMPPSAVNSTDVTDPVDGFVKCDETNTSSTIDIKLSDYNSSVTEPVQSFSKKAITATLLAASALSGLTGNAMANTTEPPPETTTAIHDNLELKAPASDTQAKADTTSTETSKSRSFFRGEGFFKEIDNANYETQVGDYKLKVDYVDTDFDIKPRFRPKIEDGGLTLGGKLYLQGENDFMKTELVKDFQQGDWSVSQGIRAGIDTDFKLGYEGSYNTKTGSDNASYSPISEAKVHVSSYGFRTYNRDFESGKHLRLDFVAGADHEFIDNNTVLRLAARQELTGGNMEIIGQKFTWMMEAKEGVSYNIQDGHTGYDYELFAGLAKKIPMKMFGKNFQVELKAGPKIEGNERDAFGFKPVIKAKVRF